MHRYVQLNDGWNADPNMPDERIATEGDALVLDFRLNPFQFPKFANGQWARLRFASCTRYRLGGPNDEGWYRGQDGFAVEPPVWGEFYEIVGEAPRSTPSLWTAGPAASGGGPRRRFLFYLRESTFECDAADWQLEVQPAPGGS